MPDLYNGVATTSATTASQFRDGLDVGLALAVVDDAIQTAREAVSYYGTLDSAEHGVTPCPVLLQLAEIDSWPVGGEPEGLIAHLKDHGTPGTGYTYLGAEHSFANESLPEKWNPTAAFLEEYLSD